MPDSDFEKTEAPTARRRQEARREGNIARSPDLIAACALLVGVVLLHIFGLRVMGELKHTLEMMLGPTAFTNPTRVDDMAVLGARSGKAIVAALAPLVLGVTAVAVLVSVSQVGFLLTAKPLEPNLAKLSPLRGLKNLFNARSGMRLVMSLGKVALIVLVAGLSIHWELSRIVMLGELDTAPLFAAACEVVYAVALKLAAVLLLLALLDYAFQRWQHTRDLRMSKQEVKEELKRMEGDPLIKQRRTRVARQLALQRIGQDVPKADVVVTNPTHFSVALRYDSGKESAPRVVAKGADFLAMRIRQIATANGIPLVERKELARALYREVEVGQQIPPEYYAAVAEILAYVYRLSGRKTA